MLIALSDQKQVLAGRTPFKNFQPLQHTASAWFQASEQSIEARLLVAIELVDTPKLGITERLDATSTLGTRTQAIEARSITCPAH